MRLTKREIHTYIKEPEWQACRLAMKGKTTAQKLNMMKSWLVGHKWSHASKVQVMNYFNALTRGGQIKMEDKRRVLADLDLLEEND